MTLPALTLSPRQSSRSAALMKALGSDADAVWDLLSPDETDRLKADMQSIDANEECPRSALISSTQSSLS